MQLGPLLAHLCWEHPPASDAAVAAIGRGIVREGALLCPSTAMFFTAACTLLAFLPALYR